ncbi:ABC transporter substrate-binding protein [Rhodococcus gannanensis]|uniref:ABC transporter substrate-binding protein n=1 Tax=Rhodococcus gannanensis TaxID=1960308 RepID=A0ABW4P7S7_9NOCA
MALLVAGCSGRESGSGSEEGAGDGGTSVASGDFGDLSDVCGPGDASTASATGVTADEINVGVFSDMGFTKNSEFADAAKVFTSWCNEAGGINGRTIAYTVRDSKLMEVRQRMIEACRDDFALVGGGSALDGLGVKERLNCLLPSFPAQIAQIQSAGADLEISAAPTQVNGYDPYYGYRKWLMTEGFPGSGAAVGIINGDSPVTSILGAQAIEATEAAGGTFVYNDLYPASGVADWTPYAQTIKSKGVKGLIFYGDFKQLAKLEDVLTGMDYKLDWIDANSNAYNQSFLELAGNSLDAQNNFADLGGVAPLESDNPATQQVIEMFDKYAPDAQITLPGLRAMSSWLLFAKSAGACGDDLTRACLLANAAKETAWTGGGLQAPVDLSNPTVPQPCFNVEEATPDGWTAADFQPDNGLYRCDVQPYKYTKDYGRPLTLADVGKSMNDVQ